MQPIIYWTNFVHNPVPGCRKVLKERSFLLYILSFFFPVKVISRQNYSNVWFFYLKLWQ